MKIRHLFIYLLFLVLCGCCQLPRWKGFIFENNTSLNIFITSETANMCKITLEPHNIGEIDHFRGALTIVDDKGCFWHVDDLSILSDKFINPNDIEWSKPLYVKNERRYFFNRYNQSIKMMIENDKLYVMPSDERIHGLYKRLQPEGFPIMGVYTNVEHDVLQPDQQGTPK